MGIDTGTTSIHVTKDDKSIFEKFDMENLQIGQAYHTAVEEMEVLRDYRREKKQEIREEVQKLKKEAEALGIEWNEVV